MRKVEFRIIQFTNTGDLERRVEREAETIKNLLEVVVTDIKPMNPESRHLFLYDHPDLKGYASVMFVYE